MFAHAGMSLYEERTIYPANSFEAIQNSVDNLGAEGVELDIRMTKDCVLVLFHDQFITTSPGFSGCVGNYNWQVLKGLKLNNSKYSITKLDTVMDYLVSRNVKMYLDIKPYNHCAKSNKPLNIIAARIDSIMEEYTASQRKLVIAGSLNRTLLQLINADYKCFESSNVNYGISVAEADNFQYLMFARSLIDEESALHLIHSPFRWGVFGGKSNSEIRKTISLKPDCFISDNFAFTQKITK